jgi:hypothetical protein
LLRTDNRGATGLIVVLLLAGLAGPRTAAQDISPRAGTYSMTLLNGGIGPVGTGLSEALTAWQGSSDAVYWNPAAAYDAAGDGPRLLLAGARLLADLRQTSVAYMTRMRGAGVAFQVLYFGLSDIPVRGDMPTVDPIATTSAYDLVGSVTVALPIPGGGSAGASLKGLYEKLDVADAAGVALDAGAQLPMEAAGRPIRLGVAVRNVGRMGELERERLKLPWSVSAGVALAEPVPLGNLLVGAGLDWFKPADDHPQVRLGVEAAVQMVRLRTGFRYGEGWNTFSTGLGIVMPGWSVEYAYVFDPDINRRALGNVQRLGVAIGLGSG